MSLLNVMVDKKLLRRKPQGRAFLYLPRVSERPTLRRMVADLVERAFGGSTEQLVMHALEHTEPSAEELDEIRAMIQHYRSTKEDSS
jgi:predicted transcriptional regulator